MSERRWSCGEFPMQVERLAATFLGKCSCGESYILRKLQDPNCGYCGKIEVVADTRARVLAEVRAAVEEMFALTGRAPNVGPYIKRSDVLALFAEGGKFDPKE